MNIELPPPTTSAPGRNVDPGSISAKPAVAAEFFIRKALVIGTGSSGIITAPVPSLLNMIEYAASSSVPLLTIWSDNFSPVTFRSAIFDVVTALAAIDSEVTESVPILAAVTALSAIAGLGYVPVKSPPAAPDGVAEPAVSAVVAVVAEPAVVA